jgi:hypothetical protein
VQLKGVSAEGIRWTFSGNMKEIDGGLQAHGAGKCRYDNGELYVGQYRLNLQHGKGKYTYASGEVYEGEYTHDCKHGRGKYTWPDGDWYDGEWQDDKINGRGTRSTNGVQKTGRWSNARYLGK